MLIYYLNCLIGLQTFSFVSKQTRNYRIKYYFFSNSIKFCILWNLDYLLIICVTGPCIYIYK